MGNIYFEFANLEHFWIRRRFDVLKKLAGRHLMAASSLADFGCGHGVLQSQVERAFGKTVDGFDLNEEALLKAVAKKSNSFCYDLHARKLELKNKYEVIFLFDVLEHIEDDNFFLKDLVFHLAENGIVIINVPALPALFSAYDMANGHCRRYTRNSLHRAFSNLPLVLEEEVFWGLPFVPLLFLRKFVLKFSKKELAAKQALGFQPPASWLNQFLYCFSFLELLRINPFGTSLMAVLRKNSLNSTRGLC